MSRGQVVAAKPLSDGKRIRWTLEQVAHVAGDRVRIDWLRFTVPVTAVLPFDERQAVDATRLGDADWRARELDLAARLSQGTDEPAGALYVARKAAQHIAELLGGFELGTVEDKGMDFYLTRVALLREGETVGFVLAGGKSGTQAATVHVNLFGSACLHLSPEKYARIADYIRAGQGWITRCDLAVDVFSGDDISELPAHYLDGAFDVRGQRPAQREAGSWTSGHSRTFYAGRRETGKEFRGYEKGHELFGPDSGDGWIRYEVEFRNNARVIDIDILTRPADFYAGAYPFCAALLDRLNVQAEAQRIPAGQKVKDATAKAAAYSVLRYLKRVVAPTVSACLQYAGDAVEWVIDSEAHRLPSRLRGWAPSEIAKAFATVSSELAPSLNLSHSGA